MSYSLITYTKGVFINPIAQLYIKKNITFKSETKRHDII